MLRSMSSANAAVDIFDLEVTNLALLSTSNLTELIKSITRPFISLNFSYHLRKLPLLGSGCGSVGGADAYDSRDVRVESSH